MPPPTPGAPIPSGVRRLMRRVHGRRGFDGTPEIPTLDRLDQDTLGRVRAALSRRRAPSPGQPPPQEPPRRTVGVQFEHAAPKRTQVDEEGDGGGFVAARIGALVTLAGLIVLIAAASQFGRAAGLAAIGVALIAPVAASRWDLAWRWMRRRS
jgi:hypothetical protein